MTKKRTVTIRKDDAEAEVMPSSVKLYLRKGWKVYQADAKEVGYVKNEDGTGLTKADTGTSSTTDKNKE